MRESTISRKGFFAFIGTAIAAVALSLAFAPNAFAATMTGYDLYTESTGDLDQHVILELKYDGEVTIDYEDAVMDDLTTNLHVTGPEGSQLELYIFDDAMLQDMGWTFNGVVSSDGVMEGYLPGQD